MQNENAIRVHDQDAAAYDGYVTDYGSHAHDVLFGLCYEFVHPGDSLLDLGIGTGLSSLPFARLGLSVTGVDGSAAMLAVCAGKSLARELLCRDLADLPLPYADAAFDHATACGVFHFFDNLGPLFAEVSRLLRGGGFFAFTVADERVTSPDKAEQVGFDAASGVGMYAHSGIYVRYLLQHHSFTLRKLQHFYAHSLEHHQAPLLLGGYVVEKERGDADAGSVVGAGEGF